MSKAYHGTWLKVRPQYRSPVVIFVVAAAIIIIRTSASPTWARLGVSRRVRTRVSHLAQPSAASAGSFRPLKTTDASRRHERRTAA